MSSSRKLPRQESVTHRHWRRRSAISTVEVFVACTLLSTTLAVATPLIVRHGRLLKAQRDYRLAIHELANQLERLQSAPADQVTQRAAEVTPSPFAASRLSGLALKTEVAPAEVGRRLTIFATWDEVGRSQAPLSLSTWIADSAAGQTALPEAAEEAL